MAKDLYNHIKYIDDCLKQNNIDFQKLKNEQLIKIQFFQHERLIHLLVTLFYVIFMIIFLVLGLNIVGFMIVALILMICVFFYALYYFKLENGVQYLYKQYDQIVDKLKEKER